LVDACGITVALDLELSGEPIDAHRALQTNLVTRVVAPEELMGAAHSLAQRIVGHDQSAVRSAKDTVLDVVGRRLDDQLEREALSAYSIDRDAAHKIVEAISLRRS
jgi:enoyl-CoA hydratase/carnithine racemase